MIQHLSMLTQASSLPAGSNLWLLIGIAVAACVLGIQVACISILIRKVKQAKIEKLAQEEEERRNSYRFPMFLAAVSVPFSAELVLAILLGLSAVASVVFLVLLIAVRSKGYDFSVLGKAESNSDAEDARVEEEIEAEPTPVELDLPQETEKTEELESNDREPVVAQEETLEEIVFVEAPEETAADEDIDVYETDAEEELEPNPDAGEDISFESPEAELAVPAFAEQDAQEDSDSVGGMEPMEEDSRREDASKDAIRVVTIEKTTTVKTETTKEIRDSAEGQGSNPLQGVSSEQAERLLNALGELAEKIDSVHLATVAQAPQNVRVLDVDEPIPTDEEDEEDESELADADDGEDAEEDADEREDAPERFTGNERIIGYDEATGYYIVAHYRKSFQAKLIQSKPAIKHYYSELKNALLAYKGTKSRISWTADSFHNGRSPIAKINVKTNILELYLALDPASLEGTSYRGKDVSHLKKYVDTPFRYFVKTPRKFGWAMELVQRVCEEHGLSPIDIEKVDYEAAYPFEETEALVARDLIKEYIREQKAANSFELDESHVPTVVDMDETVIPASATVRWELDNDELEKKDLEEETKEEPAETVSEEVPAAEPVEAPAVPKETVVTTTEETTKVRYTEQYLKPDEENGFRPFGEELLRGEFADLSDMPETDSEESDNEELEADAPEVTEDADHTQEEELEEADEAFADAGFDAEESDEETDEEEDSELLSAFEEDSGSRFDPEDDLNWGIPEELLAHAPLVIEPEAEAEEYEQSGEESEYSEEEIDYAEIEPEGVADHEINGSDGLEDAEEADDAQEALEPDTETEDELSDDESFEDSEEESAEEELAAEEQADEGEIDYGYYDENGNFVYYDGYYDENGDFVYYETAEEEAVVEETEKPEEAAPAEEDEVDYGYYDENGNFVYYDGYYDENGNFVYYETAEEEAVVEKTEEPKEASAEASELDYGYYDENGNFVYYDGYYDENGEFIYYDTEATEEAVEEAPVAQSVRSANPDVALVDLAVIAENFPAGAEVDLNALKAKGLVMPTAKYLKICKSDPRYVLQDPYTVLANQFTMDALMAITMVEGGDAQTYTKK